METDLMGWPFEPGKLPESLPADLAIGKVLDIVKDSVIGHRSFHDIIVMGVSQPAGHNEIQPFYDAFASVI